MIEKSKGNIIRYLCLIAFLWAFCLVTLKLWLMPYSIAYSETGEISFGYLLYAFIGMFLSTPAPFVSVLIIARCKENISWKDFFHNIIYTENKVKTLIITGTFCVLALVYALVNGTPKGSPWYMMPLGFIIMIPFVGIAEETGWRGFLQPAIDDRIKYPFSVLIVASIWYVWHLDLWLDPTSNHYGDSLIGFAITIFIWSFALAAIYKATRSIIACAVYHAFIDAIGAIYDWNMLFDTFPGNIVTNVYRLIWLGLSVLLWIWEDSNNLQRSRCNE